MDLLILLEVSAQVAAIIGGIYILYLLYRQFRRGRNKRGRDQ